MISCTKHGWLDTSPGYTDCPQCEIEKLSWRPMTKLQRQTLAKLVERLGWNARKLVDTCQQEFQCAFDDLSDRDAGTLICELMADAYPPDMCLECTQPATWVRHTQFSGDHPFCEEHARQEKDFGQEDPSYFYWRKITREKQIGVET